MEARVHTTVQVRSLESLCSRSFLHAWVHAARKADAVHSWLKYSLRSRRHQQCVIPKKMKFGLDVRVCTSSHIEKAGMVRSRG